MHCAAPPAWAGRQRSGRPLRRVAEEAPLEAVERPEDEGMLLQEVLPRPQLPLWASLDRWPRLMEARGAGAELPLCPLPSAPPEEAELVRPLPLEPQAFWAWEGLRDRATRLRTSGVACQPHRRYSRPRCHLVR